MKNQSSAPNYALIIGFGVVFVWIGTFISIFVGTTNREVALFSHSLVTRKLLNL